MKLIESLYNIKKRIYKFFIQYFTVNGLYHCILPDKIYLKKLYLKRKNVKLNLKHPKTFDEKQNWLKLNNRCTEHTIMSDKYKSRKFIADILGEGYTVPIIGMWDSADKIDFSQLPNQFVLKCNHDNGVVVCKNKSELDTIEIVEYLNKKLALDFSKKLREWPYKNIDRCIICEKYMTPPAGDKPLDYKLLCFNGKVKYIAVFADRFEGETKEDYYDTDWNYYDMTYISKAGDVYDRPDFLDEMIKIAEILSKNIPFLRVDFNLWDTGLYIGELTFFHHGGFSPLKDEWQYKLGSLIQLNNEVKK